MICVDCCDTGVIGVVLAAGDYCRCEAGQLLKEEMESCGNCGNIDTEAECHDDCPHLSPTGPNYDHIPFSDLDDPNLDEDIPF